MRTFAQTVLTHGLLITGLLAVSCTKEVAPVNDNESYDKATYLLRITPGYGSGVKNGTKEIYGQKIRSTWDEDLGIVWLGTDEVNLPIATITLEVGENHPTADPPHADAHNITISTSDVRFGTAEELNAKLFVADYAMILFPKRGAEHFTGLIQGLTMREVTTGEEVQVAFEFVTVSE